MTVGRFRTTQTTAEVWNTAKPAPETEVKWAGVTANAGTDIPRLEFPEVVLTDSKRGSQDPFLTFPGKDHS